MSTVNLNTYINTKVEIIKRDGSKYDISELVKGITWSGDYKSCGRKLEFSIIASNTDVNMPKVNIELGEMVIFSTSKELFRGYVTDRERKSGSSEIKFVAFDKGFYINQNKGAYNFKGATAEGIANKICDEFKISKGSFATTNVKIDKVFIGTSLYEIIMSAYTEAAKKTNKKYMMCCVGDKISVIEKGKSVLSVTFEDGNNLISTSFKESIQKMVNKVVIVDDKGNKKDEVYNEEWMKLYGVLQDVVSAEDGKDSKAEASSKLSGVEQSCSLSGYGDTTCVTGYGVKIKDSFTGLVGLFYIDSDSHSFQNGEYSIDLDLSFKNIMDERTSGNSEDTSSNSSNSSGSSDGSSNSSNSKGNKLVDLAKSKLGCKYVWGASGPSTFDCSGLTSWCHKQIGINIPRTSSDQSRSGASVSKSNLQPGDLMFFNTNGKGVSHVGMYVGNNQMIHAPNPNKPVKYEDINSSYYKSRYVNARRYY